MTNITIAQKFAATIAIMEGQEPEIEFSAADAVEFLNDRMAKATRIVTPRATKPETVEFRNAVASLVAEMEGEFKTKDIVAATGESSQKCSAALRYLVGEGVLAEVPAGESKSKAKVYTFIG